MSRTSARTRFNSVLGCGRGRLPAGVLSPAFTVEAERAAEMLWVGAMSGDLAQTLSLLARHAHSQAPALTVLQDNLIKGLFQRHAITYMAASTNWANEFTPPLLSADSLMGLSARAQPILRKSFRAVLAQFPVIDEGELVAAVEQAVAATYKQVLVKAAAARVDNGIAEVTLKALVDVEAGVVGVVAAAGGFNAAALAAMISESAWRRALTELLAPEIFAVDAVERKRRRKQAGLKLARSLELELARQYPQVFARARTRTMSAQDYHPAIMAADLGREQMLVRGLSRDKVIAATGLSATTVRRLLARSTKPRTTFGGGRSVSPNATATFASALSLSSAVLYLCGLTVELAAGSSHRTACGRLRQPVYGHVLTALQDLEKTGTQMLIIDRITALANGSELPETDKDWMEPFRQLVAAERLRLGLPAVLGWDERSRT